MFSVILSWMYISLLCTLIGIGMLGLFKNKEFPFIYYLVSGMTIITVYVEFFSIFMKIGFCAHALLFVIAFITGYIKRNMLPKLWKSYKSVICSWEGFFYLCFILLIAFFTSRGEFHTDTNIYHAAAIRLYEEYGFIKGIGNLQLHYAYNSAYLAFASIFSLNWLFGRSLHTTTGFLEVVMCLYAFHGLKGFIKHRNHIADMLRISILFYTLVNVTRSMSPATDYATMFSVLFIITAWCENLFEKQSDDDIYALLSIMAVFVSTLKFSACFLVFIAVYPGYSLAKNKK